MMPLFRSFSSLALFLHDPAWDIIVVLFFLTAGFIWGSMGGGKAKLLSFLFATYVALFISPMVFDVLSAYKIHISIYQNLIVYFTLLVVVFMLFQRAVFAGITKASYKWWYALLMSFLSVGFFVAGTLNILSFRGIIEFSVFTKTLFAGKNAYLFWSLVPFVGLLITSKNK